MLGGMNTILIRNGLLVDAESSWKADLLISGEKISRIADHISLDALPADTEIVDADELCVMPGIIDAHTHYQLVSRGTVTADRFEEGSRLAAFGGVTTVIDFADHDKGTTLPASAKQRIEAMKQGMAIDFALHQGVYAMHERIEGELEALAEAGVTTIKIFTTYKQVGYLIEMEGLRELFAACKRKRIMVSVPLRGRCVDRTDGGCAPGNLRFLPTMRSSGPPKRNTVAIMRVGELAIEAGIPLYVVHLFECPRAGCNQTVAREGRHGGGGTTPHYPPAGHLISSRDQTEHCS